VRTEVLTTNLRQIAPVKLYWRLLLGAGMGDRRGRYPGSWLSHIEPVLGGIAHILFSGLGSFSLPTDDTQYFYPLAW